MNKRQLAAVEGLRKALERCHEAGLVGGVYEYAFRVWPADVPHPGDQPPWKFFEYVEEVGASVRSKMVLDGGSGV